jgi:hypothetical protein
MQQHNSTVTTKPTPVRLRPIALPVEHGGWSMVGAPIVLGLWLAPSPAGFWLSLAAFGAFLGRQPLKLAVGDYRRGKRFPRTVWAERFVLGYGAIALIAFGMAWWYTTFPFWPPIILALPFAAIQLFFDLRKQSRALLAELAGAIAISALAAVIVMAAGWALWSALVLWLLLSLQAVTAIVYVRIRLRLARNEPAHHAPALILHLAAFVIVAGLLSIGWASWPVLLVFALLFLRCWIGLLPRSLATPTPLVGVQEVIVTLMVVVGIRFGLS